MLSSALQGDPKRRAQDSSRLLRFAMATMLAGVLGCGGGPFDLVGVSGTVLYEDGEPIAGDGFRMKFVPLLAESPDGKNFPRGATAVIEPDGSVGAVTTRKYDDGLISGRHRVYLKLGPSEDGAWPVPPEYTSPTESPIEIDTNESRRLDIRVPRP